MFRRGCRPFLHTIRREEAVLDPLAQAVSVDRVAEILIGVTRLVPQRRRGHAELDGRREVVKDDSPTAVVATRSAMTFIDDDQIEKIGPVLTKDVLADGGQRLIDAEVQVATLADIATRNLISLIAKQ